MGKVKELKAKKEMEFERKIEIGGMVFEIESNFRKSHKLSKYRNRLKYGKGIEPTEENKEAFLEIEKLQQETPRGKMPDITKLSFDAYKILVQMSEKTADIYEIEELLEIGSVLTDIEDKKKLEKLYDKEVATNGFDSLVDTLLYGLQVVFMNAKDGLEESNPVAQN